MAGYQTLFAQAPAAKRKLRIAGIGVGGMGLNNMTNLASEDIVALCDVDQRHARAAIVRRPRRAGWELE